MTWCDRCTAPVTEEPCLNIARLVFYQSAGIPVINGVMPEEISMAKGKLQSASTESVNNVVCYWLSSVWLYDGVTGWQAPVRATAILNLQPTLAAYVSRFLSYYNIMTQICCKTTATCHRSNSDAL